MCLVSACGSCLGSAILGSHRGAALARCVVALQSRLLSSRQGCDWGSEVSRVSPWPPMRSVIRPPGADYLVGWRETTVSKKWSGDYDGGVGNSNSGG